MGEINEPDQAGVLWVALIFRAYLSSSRQHFQILAFGTLRNPSFQRPSLLLAQAAGKLFPELRIPPLAPSPMASDAASKTQSQVIYR